jgi:hypothetical protein
VSSARHARGGTTALPRSGTADLAGTNRALKQGRTQPAIVKEAIVTIFKNLGFGMVLAAGVATGVAAHQGTAQQTPPPKSPQMKMASQTAKHGAVTLTRLLSLADCQAEPGGPQ